MQHPTPVAASLKSFNFLINGNVCSLIKAFSTDHEAQTMIELKLVETRIETSSWLL